MRTPRRSPSSPSEARRQRESAARLQARIDRVRRIAGTAPAAATIALCRLLAVFQVLHAQLVALDAESGLFESSPLHRGFLAIQSLVEARPRCDLRPRTQRASNRSLWTNAAEIEERLHVTLQH